MLSPATRPTDQDEIFQVPGKDFYFLFATYYKLYISHCEKSEDKRLKVDREHEIAAELGGVKRSEGRTLFERG